MKFRNLAPIAAVAMIVAAPAFAATPAAKPVKEHVKHSKKAPKPEAAKPN